MLQTTFLVLAFVGVLGTALSTLSGCQTIPAGIASHVAQSEKELDALVAGKKFSELEIKLIKLRYEIIKNKMKNYMSEEEIEKYFLQDLLEGVTNGKNQTAKME